MRPWSPFGAPSVIALNPLNGMFGQFRGGEIGVQRAFGLNGEP